jgi:pimeloyl-ACP methyl ester carboxylesterase
MNTLALTCRLLAGIRTVVGRLAGARSAGLAAAATVAALAAAFCVPAAATSATAARAATASSAPRVPVLHWQSCDDGFQCATARVPLDYRDPEGAMISIAVIRHTATDPAQRIGSLFFDGGGPTELIDGFPANYAQLPAAVRARFDILTFDPRGFGYSTAVRCFPTATAEQQFLAGLPPFPVGAQQTAAWGRTWAEFDARCARYGGPLLDHDSTADVARDLNLLRQAVGDPVLNYIGISYGTLLGATYANMFPATTGRMILDGNIDPATWTREDGVLTADMRQGEDLAAAATLRAFLDLCGKAGVTACAFSAGRPAATVSKWDTLLRRLRAHPLTLGTPPQTYTYADVVNALPLGRVAEWQSGASMLQQLWDASISPSAGSYLSAAAISPGSALASVSAVYTGRDQTLAEVCADSPEPRDLGAYAAAAKLAYARSGPLGPPNAWSGEECAGWPQAASQDRYTGPWNRPTASTILVLGNTGDPTTPYQDSVAMSRELARARLLTIDGYGHTAASNRSTCAIDYEVGYMLTGVLPRPGTVCRQDVVPFPASSS